MFCLNCGLTLDKKGKYCSRKCAAKHRVTDLEYLKKLSNSGKLAKRDSHKHTDETKLKISESLKLSNTNRPPRTHSLDSRKKMSDSQKGRIAWNKGLAIGPHTLEHNRKISANNKGGNCKWYEIKKSNNTIVKVQGSYEYRFAKVLNDLDENWIKPTIHERIHQFKWIDDNGISHWYTPDFWSPKHECYFEIKGFWAKNQIDKRKFVESLENVKIIYVPELEEFEKKNR